MKKLKYVIIYEDSYEQKVYSYASSLVEAQKHIVECIEELDIKEKDINCLEIKKRHIETKLIAQIL